MRISEHLQSAVVRVGDSYTLSIAAEEGSAPVTYSWTKDNAPHGNRGPELLLNPVEAGHAGTYTVVATDTTQAQATSSATVMVVDPSAAVTWPQWDEQVARKAAGWMGGALGGVTALAVLAVSVLIQKDVDLEAAHVAAPCAVLLVLFGVAQVGVSAWVVVMDTRMRVRSGQEVLLPTPNGPMAVAVLSAWRGALIAALAGLAVITAGVVLLVTMLR